MTCVFGRSYVESQGIRIIQKLMVSSRRFPWLQFSPAILSYLTVKQCLFVHCMLIFASSKRNILFCFDTEMVPKARFRVAKVSDKILVPHAAVFRDEIFQRELDPEGSDPISTLVHQQITKLTIGRWLKHWEVGS